MAELTAKSPCDGLLPVTVGALKLSEEDLGYLTTIAVYLLLVNQDQGKVHKRSI